MLLVADDGALEIVEREVVGDLLRLGVLDNVAPHDLLLWLLLGAHPVLKLGLVKDLRHVHALEVTPQQINSGIDVLCLDLAQPGGGCSVRQLVTNNLSCLCAAIGKRGEANVVQLLPVNGAVEVAAG